MDDKSEQNICYVVVHGYHGNDGYIDGTIRIFSTRQKAEDFIKKLDEEMKKRKRPGEQFSDYYTQTIMEMEIEWKNNQSVNCNVGFFKKFADFDPEGGGCKYTVNL